jgi:alkylation response protein AidB-like acyl-CoA dehydrogenase
MLELPPDHRALLATVRRFCRERLEPHVAAFEAGDEPLEPFFRELSESLGLRDVASAIVDGTPSPFEGLPPLLLTSFVMHELSRCCPGVALSFGATTGLFGGAIVACGTDEQKRTWGKRALALDLVGAWALTEPGAGSDAFGSMKTRARAVDGGFILRGSKTFITNAPTCDVALVQARIEGTGDGRIAGFIVPTEARGFTRGRPFDKFGMQSSPTGELFLEDVFVPNELVLGGVGPDGLPQDARIAIKASLGAERLGMIPMLLAMVERCLEESLTYAKGRVQFGEPIANYQLVQQKLANIHTTKVLLETLFLRQTEAIALGRLDAITRAEASAHKLYAAKATVDAAMEAVQVMGGAGYMRGSVVEMMARDAKLFQIGGGTDDMQVLTIARDLLRVR